MQNLISGSLPILIGQNQEIGIVTIVLSAIGLIVVFVSIVLLFFCLNMLRWYLQSVFTGAGVKIMDLVGMYFRKVRASVIVPSKIMSVQAGLDDPEITTKSLEAHYMAGGNVPLVIRSLIAANKAKTIQLSFREASAIDLAGRNVLEAVQTSVYPRVIDCPERGSARKSLDAVAKDGIQLKVRARVTVRSNLQQLIGGATEETIIARVGEGIVSAIGSEVHSAVLENPDVISKTVLARRLDSQTAFEIVSIDIADIDVGDNIGARLRADQAEADTRVARARAEGRRAMAVAQEQENMAGIEEQRAKLVAAEADIPKAMADSFRSGKLGILEYYKLRNVQADTDMRKSISSAGESTSKPAPR